MFSEVVDGSASRRYPSLPLCKVKSGAATDLIPMEMLVTSKHPQRYLNLIDYRARKEIPKVRFSLRLSSAPE